MPFSSKLLQMGAAGAAEKLYVENVFSTYLYTGNSTNRSITNDIDLSGKGGLVWIKDRDAGFNHTLFDTNRGATKYLFSDSTNAEGSASNTLTAFNSNGFNLGTNASYTNGSGITYASWTFRKAKKFFDIVTYTGDGTGTKTINHNLGTTPRFIIIKRTDSTGDWFVSARTTGDTQVELLLNSTAANYSGNVNISSYATSTLLKVGDSQWSATANGTNINNATYVAYLFAHNAGGFGLTGSDNVISCGIAADGDTVNLGYEPQWILFKKSNGTSDWYIYDTMRGMPVGSNAKALFPNLADAESLTSEYVSLRANGFVFASPGGVGQWIYIAIRRGPMKTPTTGTSVFDPVAYSGTSTNDRIITSSVTPDLVIWGNRSSTGDRYEYDRLRGSGTWLKPNTTGAEGADGTTYGAQFNKVQTGYQQGTSDGGFLNSSSTYINWLFRRAPGFFDVVCYTGNGSTQNVNHNLGVVPELIIAKSRSLSDSDWWVYSSSLATPQNKYLRLQSTDGESTVSGLWGTSLPTATTFGLGAFAPNSNAATFVAYLFASCPGVSKVGSYTGNGSSVTVTTNFQPRFILVKRTDSTGNWIVGDSARGLPTGNDPALFLNTTAAETTGQDWVDVSSTGFTVNETALNANVNTATYIYLAIA